MLWLLLYRVWRGLRWLLALPPSKHPKIASDAACPACGATRGVLKAVRPATLKSEAGVLEPVMIMHRCYDCGGRWYEKTITKDPKGELIHPAE